MSNAPTGSVECARAEWCTIGGFISAKYQTEAAVIMTILPKQFNYFMGNLATFHSIKPRPNDDYAQHQGLSIFRGLTVIESVMVSQRPFETQAIQRSAWCVGELNEHRTMRDLQRKLDFRVVGDCRYRATKPAYDDRSRRMRRRTVFVVVLNSMVELRTKQSSKRSRNNRSLQSYSNV